MVIKTGEWDCPFCGKAQLATDRNVHREYSYFAIGETIYGKIGVENSAVRCLNPACNKVTIECRLTVANPYTNGHYMASPKSIQKWRLSPASSSKPQPDCVPAVLRDDYYEACAISELSPKASATLARRCLQGMIRDFCGISKPTLNEEIKSLRSALDEDKAPKGVQSETVDAIDAVRKVGNIGAHMERDIDMIVDVDPGEAQALLELIEMLFDEWYVASEKRRERLAKVESIAAEKAALIAKMKADAAQAAVDGTQLPTEPSPSE